MYRTRTAGESWYATACGRWCPVTGYGSRGRLRGPEVYRPGSLPPHPAVHWTAGQGTPPAELEPDCDRRPCLACKRVVRLGVNPSFISSIIDGPTLEHSIGQTIDATSYRE
jgi:hypothetical protein